MVIFIGLKKSFPLLKVSFVFVLLFIFSTFEKGYINFY